MRKYLQILIIPISQLCFGQAPANQIDSISNLLTGCWRMDYYYGGFGGLPPQKPSNDVRLKFNRDALDSVNQTVSYWTYVDSLLADSGRAVIAIDSNYATWFTLSPDVLAGGLGLPIHFRSFNDSIEFTHFQINDDFYYVFGRDSCIQDSTPVPPDTTNSVIIDSIIQEIKGCWRFHAYESWGQMHPADTVVYLSFSQDAQDSLNHTVTYRCFNDSTLVKTDRTSIVPDSLYTDYDGYFVEDVLGAVIGAIGGTIRDQLPTDFYYFNDTLKIWDATIMVDAPYYYFVRDSCEKDTIVNPPDTTDFTTIDSIIGVLNGCWKWDHYFGGFAGLPPTPATSDVRIEFSQDAQDSMNHTVSCRSYEDSVLQFSGKCSIDDTSAAPFYLLSCPIFDSIGIVGSPPLYFHFENDTLLFPQQQFVDGFVYGFLKNCVPDDTTSVPETADEDFIIIYPNPASEEIHFYLKNAESFRISIYNMVGQQFEAMDKVYDNIISVDISKYPNGNYIIRVETPAAVIVRKFIVQR